MRDHERKQPPEPRVQPAEQKSHQQVPDERRNPLVEVVAASEHGRSDDDRPDPPPQATQPVEEVADHDHLLGEGGAHGGEDQDRHRPPVGVERCGDDIEGEVERSAAEIEGEAGHTDHEGEGDSGEDVAAGPGEVQSEEREVRTRDAPEQEQHESHGNEVEEDREELVNEVERGPRTQRLVQGGRLRPDRLIARRRVHDRDDRVDGGRSE